MIFKVRNKFLKHASISIFSLVCTLLFSPFVHSQSEQVVAQREEEIIFRSSQNLHQWGSINSFHGLPSEKINAIAQTNTGFLWFATDNGLARFDGRRVQTDLSQGVSSFRVYDVKVDANDALWIATDKGAYYFANETFKQLSKTSNYSIVSIAIDAENNVYLADQNGLIFRAKEGKIDEVDPWVKAAVPIKSVAFSDGQLYVGTYNSGLQRSNDGELEGVPTQPRPYFINALKLDPTGKLWIGARSSSQNGGLLVAEKLPRLETIGSGLGTVNSIAFGENNERWIGTENRGACFFSNETFRKCFTFENTSGGLRSNNVHATFVDREGVVWFGTDKGVSRYDPKSARNEQITSNVESNYVRTLFETSDGIVFAGTNRGLFLYNETTNNWDTVPDFNEATIFSIISADENHILIGTANNSFRLNTKTLKGALIGRFDTRALSIYKGEIYRSSLRNGVTKGIGESEKIISDRKVLTLFNDENLWMGTIENGVLKFDGKNFITPLSLAGINDSLVKTIDGNEKDGLWFGNSSGVYRLSANNPELVHSASDVRQVLVLADKPGNREVWVGTASGLIRLSYDSNFGWISSRIDVEDGLVSHDIFSLASTDEQTILIGTNRGIVRYSQGKKKPILHTNRIVSQRVHSLNELTDGIELAYPQNSLSVDVSAISSRTFPEQFQYSFLLFDSAGIIQDKRLSSESQYVMENLEPGEYTVEVAAYDINLVKSEPLRFNVKVESAPFPWIAAILSIFLLIAIAALIWAVYSQRRIAKTSNQLTNANYELSAARLDLAKEAERERRRISRDLHDQTLADLRHLMLMADEVSTEKSPEFRGEIENVSDEIRRICEDLSPSVLENIGFTAALEWALSSAIEQVSQEKDIVTEFEAKADIEDSESLTHTDEIQVYRITQEVLSNIVRHGDPSEIKMEVDLVNDETFQLTIKDNGAKFDSTKSHTGRGLTNIRARANLIEAKVKWEQTELGMKFTISK